MALLVSVAALVTALPQIGFAQSHPFVGTWKLNLAKSTYSPGPPPKGQTAINIQGEGQNRKLTMAGINAAGNPFTILYIFIADGQRHPTTGTFYDATTYTRVDDYTLNWTCTKAGHIVQSPRAGTPRYFSNGSLVCPGGVPADDLTVRP